MTSELRWILLLIGAVFIAGLALWERRRPRQASASSAFERPAPRDLITEGGSRGAREPTLTLPEMRARDPLPAHGLPVVEMGSASARLRPPGAEEEHAESHPEATTDEVAILASAPEQAAPAPGPNLGAADEPQSLPTVAADAPPGAPAAAFPAATREVLPELPASAPPVVDWPPDEERRIVALRLVAPQPQRFAGRSLRQALAAEGFVLGRFAIFHKPDAAHRAVLSAASLNRPGTFDPDTMDSQHYGGLSLFAVLPGPKSPPQAFDELVFTARSLNDRLQGVLQDEQGGPLTPSRIASLRERLGAGAAL
jgi:cell division protein ZipA